jgi:hypothetical protein
VRTTHKSLKPEDGWWSPDYHELGSEHRFANKAAWLDALTSNDQVDILEALLLLPPRDVIEKRDPIVIARLKDLSNSTDAWIREGATAALAEFDKRAD